MTIISYTSKDRVSNKKTDKDNKNPYKPPQIITKKQFVSIFVVLMILSAVLLVIAYNDLLFPQSSKDEKEINDENDYDNNNDANDSIVYDDPKISFTQTAKLDGNLFNIFNQEDTIIVLFEYQNISHNGSLDVSLELSVKDEDDNLYVEEKYDMSSNDLFNSVNFTSNKSWPIGKYIIRLDLEDKISNKSTVGFCEFYLKEEGTPSPRLKVNANPKAGYVPLEVSFSSSVENMTGPINYSWDFDDGYNSNDLNPSHSYISVGNYRVSLKVTDSNSYSLTSFINVKVMSNIEATLNASNLVGYAPHTVFFNVLTKNFSQNPYVFWDFTGDDFINREGENLLDESYVYSDPGVYNVTVVVTDGYINLFLTCQVEVVEVLYIEFNFNIEDSILYLEGLATGGKGEYSYLWEVRRNRPSGTLLFDSSNIIDSYDFSEDITENSMIYIKFTVCDDILCNYEEKFGSIII